MRRRRGRGGADAEGRGVDADGLADLGVVHPLDVVEDECLAEGDGELVDGLERQVAGLAPEDPREDPAAAAFRGGRLDESVGRDGTGVRGPVAQVVAAEVEQDPLAARG